jgi:ATP-dependent helicase HrpB
MTSYPIDNILSQLKQTAAQNQSVVVHAPPGAGKTTRVPLALLGVIPAQTRIIMLEPRRIAAVSAARWMAQSLNEQIGETIGYSIRFDSKVSGRTRIEVVTEGILTRRIQSDPGLDGVGMIIFDEFHERTLHADLALALCLDIRKILRPELKIMVMSATLDYGPIASLLGNAPIVTSSGKAYPVEERYLDERDGYVASRMTSAIRTALGETKGDILAFLPGSGEIRTCAKELENSLPVAKTNITVHPLYGDLPFDEQEKAIMPLPGHRKIVLATNIAETSLTIEGVQVVIDSGLTRRLRYDPSNGMNRLVTVSVSKASAAQRKGRAGRLGPGVCYRLYGKQDLQGAPAFAPPEIMESDLSPLLLELAAWGVTEASALSWLDPPPAPAWNAAVQLLRDLGALDPKGAITAFGRDMVRLPLHPRLSRMLLRARQSDNVRLGAELAALLSERDLFKKNAGSAAKEPDMSARVETLRSRRQGRKPAANTDAGVLRAVERTFKQLLQLMHETDDKRVNQTVDQDEISRLLLAAYPDRVCKRRAEDTGRFVLASGRGALLSQESHLAGSPYIIAVAVDAGEKTEGYVHIAAAVSEEMIRSECKAAIRKVRRVAWDQKEGRIVAALEERVGALLLSEKQFSPSDAEALPIICDAIRTTPGILSFSPEALQFQARVRFVSRIFPEEPWPELSDEHLIAKPEQWLLSRLAGVRTTQALRGIDIAAALKAQLSWEQQRILDERAPASITVPSGSRVKLDYSSGDLPVLAVKLQEMFGVADTPTLAGGRARVLLHLLSPAGRPVQITQDLKGFWERGYPSVKKDLKGRYPKHPWPEDPWNAVPTRRVKPRAK